MRPGGGCARGRRCRDSVLDRLGRFWPLQGAGAAGPVAGSHDSGRAGDHQGDGPYRRWVDPLLADAYAQAEANQDARKQLHASLALLPVDPRQVDYLYGRLLKAEPQELVVIRQALFDRRQDLTERLWTVLANPKNDQDERLRAACALAAFAPDDPRWKEARSRHGGNPGDPEAVCPCPVDGRS